MTINSFKTHPEFLTSDFRSNRPPECGVPMDPEITIDKHSLLLSADRVKDKSILDIGSFISQTGDWCLTNGARRYIGVEVSENFADLAKKLLSKYHNSNRWQVVHDSLTNYLTNNTEQFDIVFCWGVLFGMFDHQWLLRQLARCGKHIIIESRHPKMMWKNNTFLPDSFWHELEYNIPYQEWQTGEMTMLADINASIKCTAANSSIAAINLIMQAEGFLPDLTVYEILKKKYPNNFGMFRDSRIGRFVVEYTKNESARIDNFTEEVFSDKTKWQENLVSWNKNDFKR